MADSQTRTVSFDDEDLIVVDEQDNVLEYRTKAAVHAGHGILHRAFSVFLFDGEGRMLLQQRSAGKRLWPLFWSNSCCSHPRRGESEAEAAARRVDEELGLTSELTFLFQFRYQADYGDAGAEHELCSVFLGRARGDVLVNENEIAAWRWVPVEDFERSLEAEPDLYTPWLKLEWKRMREHEWAQVAPYTRPTAEADEA